MSAPRIPAGELPIRADLLDHPAIHYGYTPVHDPVALLDPKQLKFEGPSGYLRSVLDALNIPIESKITVFSKTSLQAPLIEPRNPPTIFFNDSVAVGWMKGGFIEIAALDPRQGVQFYTLDQHPSPIPRFEKGRDCLRCHLYGRGRITDADLRRQCGGSSNAN